MNTTEKKENTDDKEIKESKNFRLILSTVLTIGNIMNGGTSKGQADGFNLDILSKLGEVKGAKGVTVMQCACDHIIKQNPEINLKDDFINLTKAADFSQSETKKSINDLKSINQIVERNLKEIEVEDEFVIKVKKKLEEMKKEAKDLMSNYWIARTYDQRTPINSSYWFTTHNSIYDIKARKLRLTIQENYKKYYEYNLN